MITFVTGIHFLVCLGLILVVLLQSGRGTDMGAVFGGSSSTIFGSSGAGNFLTRLTTAMAIVFMFTSLTLGYFAGKRTTRTIFDRQAVTAPRAAPPAASVPTQTPGGQTGTQPGNPGSPQTPQTPAGPEKK